MGRLLMRQTRGCDGPVKLGQGGVGVEVEGLLQQLCDVEGEKTDTVVNDTLLQSRESTLEGSESRLKQASESSVAATLNTAVDDAALLLSKMACFVEDSTEDNRGRVFLTSPGIERFLKPYGLLDPLELVAKGGELGRSIAILTGKSTIGLGALCGRLVELVDAEAGRHVVSRMG
jgi:hypothetical protein